MKKLSRNLVSMLILLILLILILAAVYVFGIYHFKSHFYTGSTLNGVNIGEMTADDAKYAIQNQIRHYTLTCTERNGTKEKITGDQIYMQYQDDGTIQKLLDDQNPDFWIFYLGRGKHYKTQIGYTYDKDSIDSVLNSMACFQSQNDINPTNAKVVDNGSGFTVQDATQGSSLNREKTKQAIIEAIERGTTSLDFESLGLYEIPTVNADSTDLQEAASNLNSLLNCDITYDMVDRTFTLDSNNIRDYIVQNEDGSYTLSRDRLAEFVANMAYETDTYGLQHKFRTTSGAEIELAAGGDYGWCINQSETTTDLYNALMNGQNGTREPIYLYRAMDRSSHDIGDTYVEICIEKQEMWCYQNGTLVVDTPVITGNHAAHQDTPSGCVWAIDARESPAVFEDNGGVKVQYWLPFVDSCGIHDASWRTEAMYNTETWKTHGSNGCINTPLEAAKKIYGVMNIGYPVVVYYSETQVVGTQPTVEVVPG